MNKEETVYVFVGEKGRPSNSSGGSSTKGGLPDGGRIKTGHNCNCYTTVQGTGGGSTSIRIASDTNYSRVIVAGGGAIGDCYLVNPGRFGGGQNGGNCYYREEIRQAAPGASVKAMTDTEIQEFLVQGPQVSTVKDVIQVAVVDVVGTEMEAVDIEISNFVLVVEMDQVGRSPRRVCNDFSQGIHQMHLIMN